MMPSLFYIVSFGVTCGLMPGLRQDDAAAALLDLLVFYAKPEKVDVSKLPVDAGAGVEAYVARLKTFRSRLPEPKARSSEMKMVHAAHVGYERKLAALSDDPEVPALAAAYVQKLRPCYEWEGFHDCPEREARFADDYVIANRGAPLNPFLTLLSAHRWLCAAEGYDYEKSPERAATVRKNYDARLAEAIRSTDPMIQSAAIALAQRARCHR